MATRTVAIWDEGPGAGAFISTLADDEFVEGLAELVAQFGPPSRVFDREEDEGWEGQESDGTPVDFVTATPTSKRAKERVRQHGPVFRLLRHDTFKGKPGTLVESLHTTWAGGRRWTGWLTTDEAEVK
jgi:hypothetical protein